MNYKNYRDSLKDTLRELVKIRGTVYTSMFEIIMQGELSEWSESVPIGEVHEFDFAIFQNSEDANIGLLVELYEQINSTIEAIKGINYIDLDDD